LDVFNNYFETGKAEFLQTSVNVIEGVVYVIDGENAMSLLGQGESLRLNYKRLEAAGRRLKIEGQGTEAFKTPSVPAVQKVTPAQRTLVLKSTTPPVIQQAKEGMRHGTLRNPGKNVFVRSPDGDWRSAKDGMVIIPGDEVKTAEKDSVEIILDGGKVGRVEVKEESLFRIQKADTDPVTGDKTTLLDLALGKILVKAESLKGNSKFEVRTPTALTGVRGTIFEVTVKEKA